LMVVVSTGAGLLGCCCSMGGGAGSGAPSCNVVQAGTPPVPRASPGVTWRHPGRHPAGAAHGLGLLPPRILHSRQLSLLSLPKRTRLASGLPVG
jgi:hypothetical protein